MTSLQMAANYIQKKNPTNFLSSTRHVVATIIKPDYELNVSKNDLFTDSVNMNIHTSLNKFIFFLPNFIFQKAIYTSWCFICFSYSVICILNCCGLMFVVFYSISFTRLWSFVLYLWWNIQRAIPVNHGRSSTEITKNNIQPPQA